MSEKHIGSAIVMKNDKLAGILTHSDICRSYADLLAEIRPNSNGNDAA
jgi:CBS domain-containing protein